MKKVIKISKNPSCMYKFNLSQGIHISLKFGCTAILEKKIPLNIFLKGSEYHKMFSTLGDLY